MPFFNLLFFFFSLTSCFLLSTRIVSVVALVYYLKSAWTNPGYLKGSLTSDLDPKNHIPTLNGKAMTEEEKATASKKLRKSIGVAQPGDDVTIDFDIDIEDMEDGQDDDGDESIDLENKCVSSQRNNQNAIILPSNPERLAEEDAGAY